MHNQESKDQYESIWRSAPDRRSPTCLPFGPSAVQAPKQGGNNINLGCYFTKKNLAIDINEWFDLAMKSSIGEPDPQTPKKYHTCLHISTTDTMNLLSLFLLKYMPKQTLLHNSP